MESVGDRFLKKFNQQRNAAGLVYGFDNRHGFPSPKLTITEATVWANEWNLIGEAFRSLLFAQTFANVDQQDYINVLANFQAAMGFFPFRPDPRSPQPLLNIARDANGMLLDPEDFWGPVGQLALSLRPFSESPSTLDNALDVLRQTAIDTASGVSKLVLDTANKSAGFSGELLWAALKPFLIPVGVGLGAYLTLRLWVDDRDQT